MGITIVVEDGSIVSGANSYVSLTDVRAYAADRGAALSVDDEVVNALIIKSTDYIESKRSLFEGLKVSKSQPLQFPRTGLIVDGFDIEATEIPVDLKNAQSQVVIELSNEVDVLPTVTGAMITEEKVGPITTKYSETSSPSTVVMRSVEALLEPLYRSQGFFLSTVRA